MREKWTKEKCKKLALRYKTKASFREKQYSAFQTAFNHGWLNEICSHMKSPYKPYGFWTKAKCKAAARLCKTRSEFQRLYPSAYSKSVREDWLLDVCSHLPMYKWTKERIKALTAKCKTRLEFYEKYKCAYNAAHRQRWIEEVCSHLPRRRGAKPY